MKLYSQLKERKLSILSEFIIDEYNLYNIRYANDTLLMAGTKRKLQKFLEKIKESKKKGPTINWKETNYMVASKGGRSRCELQIGDIRIKRVQKFKHVGSYF